jgi:hypothetical protein
MNRCDRPETVYARYNALRREDTPAFMFDKMEPERPKVDHAVLDFVRGHVFNPADFVIRSDGVCRLNPENAADGGGTGGAGLGDMSHLTEGRIRAPKHMAIVVSPPVLAIDIVVGLTQTGSI